MAAGQIEEKRREAEIARAEADKVIRENKAEADRAAQESELAAEIVVAEKTRDNDLKKAAFLIETETADANAEIAKNIQTQIRQVELNEQTGTANAKEKELENTVAERQNKIAKTEAERAVIEAEGVANAAAAKQKIEADAQAKVIVIEADGKADAAKRLAAGQAEAIKLEADAERTRITETGTAEADVVRLKGLAEAEAIKAQGLAKAEAERQMAEALAANESVNFRIEQIKIETTARVEIATNIAKVMADLGTNAMFVHIGGDGGSGTGGKSGNFLLDTIAGIPDMIMRGNVRSDAMNDSSLARDLGSIIDTIVGRNQDGSSKLPELLENLGAKPGQTEAVHSATVLETEAPPNGQPEKKPRWDKDTKIRAEAVLANSVPGDDPDGIQAEEELTEEFKPTG
jgi:flotillin